MCVLVGAISFIAGGIFGVAMMCLFQINSVNRITGKDSSLPENGGK